MFYVVIGLMVIGIAAAAIVNSGVLDRTLTAVTIGNHKLTAAELNYYYLDTINNTMNNNSMMSYMVTSGTPLDEQEYLGDEFDTWADYFLDTAITTARNTYAVYDEAVAKGHTLSEEEQSEVDTALSSMSTYASLYGYSGASAMLRANYGRGCNESSYREYLKVQRQLASGYANKYLNDLDYSQEEIDAYGAEDPTAYNSYSYRYYLLNTSDYYEEGVETPTDEQKAAPSPPQKMPPRSWLSPPRATPPNLRPLWTSWRPPRRPLRNSRPTAPNPQNPQSPRNLRKRPMSPSTRTC